MINKKIETTRNVTIELTGDDIIKALVDAGHIDMPNRATCEFQVLGGGDYSNMSVDVDDDAKVIVRFTEEG